MTVEVLDKYDITVTTQRMAPEIRLAGAVIQTRGRSSDRPEKREVGRRGNITEWSAKSRRELLLTINALDWDELGKDLHWLGLTSPGDNPADGATFKGWLKKFYLRWCKKWQQPAKGLWKFEYQQRGAGHVHLLLSMVEGVPYAEQYAWIKDTWQDITKGNWDKGSHVERWRYGHPRNYLGRELMGGRKEYQHTVPDGQGSPGRFWGLWGGFKVRWAEGELTQEQFYQATRQIHRAKRAVGRKIGRKWKPRKRPGAGAWVALEGASRLLELL